jgi:TPR repeat protein
MKITTHLTISFCIVGLLSCGTKEEKVFSMNQASRPYYENKKLALEQGDTNAYHEMSIEFMDSPNDDRFLMTALFMANKHNYGPAYLDVYYCLTDYYHKADNKELDDLDEKTRQLAIKYLTDGANTGHYDCKQILGQLYMEGKYLERDTLKGRELLKENE